MKLLIPEYVQALMNELNQNHYECYVVGGAVRSLLLGLPVHDYDLTTNALPSQMKEVFSSYHTIETGLKHGTLTVMSQHHPIEITTYRKDATYQDHRHPDAVEFTRAIQEDCARRDFTINAFCYNKQEGILDFFHGTEDLNGKILRCIGDPEQRFDEDALRILRAIRFASQLNFTIEKKTKVAIFAKKDLLSYISYERIHEELNGFLSAPKCASYLDTYQEVMHVFLPEIQQISQWSLVLQQMDQAQPDANVRIAILLTSLDQVSSILKRMKYANQDIHLITSLIQYRDVVIEDRISLRKFLSIYHDSFDAYLNYRQAIDSTFPYNNINEYYSAIMNDHDCISLSQLEIKGNDVAQYGYQKQEISKKLNEVLLAVMEDKINNQREELLNYVKRKDA